jgi:hypothetical protein
MMNKKYILTFVIFLICITIYGQLQTVNTGTGAPNTGETLKTAFPKVNAVINLLNTLQIYNDSTNYLERNILNGALISTIELNRLVGVTSAIQTQLNAKLAITDTTTMLARYGRLLNPQFLGVPRISTDTIATRAYARGYGGTGTLNTSDTSAMLSKYARKNSPTFIGTVSGITAGMVGALVAHDTTHLSARIDLKANSTHTQAQSTITNLSDSLLVRYTKTQANTAFLEPHDTTHLRTNVNTLISEVNDTVVLSSISVVPLIYSAAGDTSNYNTPAKIGDIYIDTSAGKVYISVTALRNGWRILN